MIIENTTTRFLIVFPYSHSRSSYIRVAVCCIGLIDICVYFRNNILLTEISLTTVKIGACISNYTHNNTFCQTKITQVIERHCIYVSIEQPYVFLFSYQLKSKLAAILV